MITSTESQGRLPRYDSRDKITKIIMITTIWGNHQIRNRKTARKTEFHQHALGYRNGHPDILYPDIGIWYMIAAAFFAAGCMRTCLGQRLAVSKLVQQFLVVSKNLGEWPKKTTHHNDEHRFSIPKWRRQHETIRQQESESLFCSMWIDMEFSTAPVGGESKTARSCIGGPAAPSFARCRSGLCALERGRTTLDIPLALATRQGALEGSMRFLGLTKRSVSVILWEILIWFLSI